MGRARVYASDAERQAAWKARNPDKVKAARVRARLQHTPEWWAVAESVRTLRAAEAECRAAGLQDTADHLSQCAGSLAAHFGVGSS